MTGINRINQRGGVAFIIGNLLFLVNKLDEMSRLFLGRQMPDVISGEDFALILLGQMALIIGYVTYYQFYTPRVGRFGRFALGLFSGGGIVVALGHGAFVSTLVDAMPFAEFLFVLVLIGILGLLSGLIWFGILNLRQSVLSRWTWLPLATGLMGLSFPLFGDEEITAVFLFFRTLFALGLIGLGLTLALEKAQQAVGPDRSSISSAMRA